MLAVAAGSTVTVTTCVPEQPPYVPVTVYVVVEDGLAVTIALVDDDNPVVVNQVYELAPFAVRTSEVPAQIVAEGGVIVVFGAKHEVVTQILKVVVAGTVLAK